jgi:hypothetical protein
MSFSLRRVGYAHHNSEIRSLVLATSRFTARGVRSTPYTFWRS